MKQLSIYDIGKKFEMAGRLKMRPVCVYGADELPQGAEPTTKISSCVARSIFTLAAHKETPPIYIGEDTLEECCGGGIAMFGFGRFNPGIKYFVSYGSKTFRNGEAEFLRATPELVEENQRSLGKIMPLGKYVIMQACSDLIGKDPGVKSILCFGIGEQIRNLVTLVHFKSHDPFREVLVPQGPSCASFVTFAAGMAERAPKEAVFLGPSDPTGNSWFPPDHLSLAIPIGMARRMADDVDSSFIVHRPRVAYPKKRIKI